MAIEEQLEERLAELSSEEAISRFLQEHPDYFQHHPQLLSLLEIPHHQSGKAVSLIERQVASLRQDRIELENRLRQLIDNATENDVLSNQLHEFTRSLILAEGLDDLLQRTQDDLRARFSVDAVAMRLDLPGQESQREEIVTPGDQVFRKICTQVSNGEPSCGPTLENKTMDWLFGERAGEIGSVAIVPIERKALSGVLVLGSHEPQRFTSGMATTYLKRIGELIASALGRYAVG